MAADAFLPVLTGAALLHQQPAAEGPILSPLKQQASGELSCDSLAAGEFEIGELCPRDRNRTGFHSPATQRRKLLASGWGQWIVVIA